MSFCWSRRLERTHSVVNGWRHFLWVGRVYNPTGLVLFSSTLYQQNTSSLSESLLKHNMTFGPSSVQENHEIRILCSASAEVLHITKKGKHPAMACVNNVDASTMLCLGKEDDEKNISSPAGGMAESKKRCVGYCMSARVRR